jgi:uncharacterized protein YbjQ (UPF0145 family)
MGYQKDKRICVCQPSMRDTAGTLETPGGTLCRICNLLVLKEGTEFEEGSEFSVQVDQIELFTINVIPNRKILQTLGLVFGAGNAAWTLEGTASKAGTALYKAEKSLKLQAFGLGANAVLGVNFSVDGSGSALNRSQTLLLMGTAVVLD